MSTHFERPRPVTPTPVNAIWLVAIALVGTTVITAVCSLMFFGTVTAPFLITGLVASGVLAPALLLLQRASHLGIQRQIEERELLLRTLLDEVEDGIELVDVDTLQFVEVNAAACRIMGWSREEYLGLRLYDTQLPPQAGGLTPEELTARVQSLYQHPQDAPPRLPLEHRHRTRSGEVIDISLHLKPITLGQARFVLAVWQDITDQKRTGQLLEIQQGYQTALLSHAPFRIWLKDRHGRYLAANQPQAQALGHRDPSALIGATDIELCPRCAAEHEQGSQSIDDLVMHERQPQVSEERFVDPDGRTRWLEVHRGVALNTQGRVLGTIGFALDITERYEARDRLRAREYFLNETQRLARIGGWRAYPAENRVEWTDEIALLLGKQPGWLPSLVETLQMYLPEEQPRVSQAIERCIATGEPFEMLTRVARPEGTVMWVELRATRHLDPGGAFDYVEGTFQDVTERQEIQAELQAYRDHLEEMVARRTEELDRLFQALPDLYFRLARDGTILDFRAGNVAELYVPPSSFLGHRMQDVLPPEVAVRFTEAFARIDHDSGMEFVEYELDVPEGHRIFEARVMPFSASQVVAVVRDITERRADEQARERVLSEAERLAQLKTEFLANMSHEIRTPLNGVLGFAQIGLRSQSLERSHEAFARIIDSGQLLLGIINDILDFSKIEAGGLHVESVPLRLATLIRESIELVQERARLNGTSLRVRLDPGLPPLCLGDPLRIRQILINLLSNAVKFTHHGQITVRLQRDVEQDDWLQLQVEDSGIGMNAEQMGRIFRPFEQGDGSTTRRFGGTGLGLAITHRLIDLMGGSIDVTSQPGQGSLFTVRLHCPAAGDPDDIDSVPDPLFDPTEPALTGLRLLVAEDNEINRQVLLDNLRTDGAEVNVVDNGRRAVDQVLAHGAGHYDLVLMDVQMPVMDGYDATRALHAVDPELPVVGQTAHAMASDRERCLAAGMVDHLAKPIDPIDLVRVVLRHARRPLSPHSPSTPSDGPQSNHSQGPAADR